MNIHLKGEIETQRVWLDNKELDPKISQRLRNHSPDGFNWGYGGSGPSQLSLAICMELFGEKATEIYQDFKWKYIASLPQKDFDVNLEINI